MIKRGFSQLSSRLLKKNENDELQATLKFLTRGSVPASSISSFLGQSNVERKQLAKNASATEESSEHVERILKILNSTLPEVESKKRRVEAHYDILFTQLKNIVEKSIEDSADARGTSIVAENSSILFNRLMMLQYTNQLSNVKQMAKLVLSRAFLDFDRVWENISLFNERQKLNLSILLYYRNRDEKIRLEYMDKWFENYHELHIITQRILWRCIKKDPIIDKHNMQHISDCVGRIPNWTSNDSIVLYQSLYTDAYLLSEDLPGCRSHLSKNQELFIASLRALSAHGNQVKDMTKWLIKIVKLSVENKIAMEKKAVIVSPDVPSKAAISIYQYRFIRGLDLVLQEIYSSCEGKHNLALLQRHLEVILRNANDEEQEVKSQMSLKFI